jgi:hypothetical protein
MAILKFILLGSILIGTVVLIIATMSAEPCTEVVSLLLSKLQGTDAALITPLFGDNTCHCQPRGGFIAYLKYESGENDNLAFLFGHKFKTGKLTVKEVPTVEKTRIQHVPWETPESTEVDLSFNFEPSGYSPYFLPLDSAFGTAIKEADLINFCRDPSPMFWFLTSLRLRPSLENGLVEPPAGDELFARPEYMSDLFRQLLKDKARYFRPTDAGKVIDKDGKTKPMTAYAAMLPRLEGGTLRVYAGRRGKFQHWAVKKVRLKDFLLKLYDGKQSPYVRPDHLLEDRRGFDGMYSEHVPEK